MKNSTDQFDNQIPMILRVFENTLRSGYNVAQCLEIIAKDLPGPAGTEAQQVLVELKDGTALPQALQNWLGRVPSPDLDLIVATILVQLEVGGNLADKFNLLAQVMNKRSLKA